MELHRQLDTTPFLAVADVVGVVDRVVVCRIVAAAAVAVVVAVVVAPRRNHGLVVCVQDPVVVVVGPEVAVARLQSRPPTVRCLQKFQATSAEGSQPPEWVAARAVETVAVVAAERAVVLSGWRTHYCYCADVGIGNLVAAVAQQK